MTPTRELDTAEVRREMEDLQDLPWTLHTNASGYHTLRDANGMFVADFGCGPDREPYAVVRWTALVPTLLDHLDAARAECERWKTTVSLIDATLRVPADCQAAAVADVLAITEELFPLTLPAAEEGRE